MPELVTEDPVPVQEPVKKTKKKKTKKTTSATKKKKVKKVKKTKAAAPETVETAAAPVAAVPAEATSVQENAPVQEAASVESLDDDTIDNTIANVISKIRRAYG